PSTLFFHHPATTEIYTLSLHDALPISTIALFRRRHHEALGKLLVQTVRLARKAGLVHLNRVAVDGTKVKAYASKHSAMSYARMKEEEARLQAEIERYLEESRAINRKSTRL